MTAEQILVAVLCETNSALDRAATPCEERLAQRLAAALQRAEAAEADVIKWRGAWEIENSLRMGAEAKLAEAQRREAWWRELVPLIEEDAIWPPEKIARKNELRRLLGLDAAKEEK